MMYVHTHVAGVAAASKRVVVPGTRYTYRQRYSTCLITGPDSGHEIFTDGTYRTYDLLK